MEPNPIHLDDLEALALVHGELAAERRAWAERHITECESCHATVERVDREEAAIARALAAVDFPVPKVDPIGITTPIRRTAPTWMRWAAVAVLALSAGGVAAAVPGSPVGPWLAALVSWASGGGPDSTPAPVAAPPTSGAPATTGGIAVVPGPGLVVQFARRQDAGSVTIRLSDEPTVAVRAPDRAVAFTSGPGRLAIDNGGRLDFEIDIPRGAARVEVRVGGAAIFVVAAGSVVTGPAPDSTGAYRIPLGLR